ncbi:caspase family protein [Streptomyces naphthomycinicus]|uniref:caspase family protein n=1 Tax=Streptomyces naphthomycinicus TaxID=2872625 RepID=UPI001CEDD9FE|nr:caspase family protein [Streptomyces sp. TML10]
MRRLPKPAESRVLLIGTSSYRPDSGFTPLRNVPHNLVHLAETLCDPVLGGFQREHCEVLPNPASGDQVHEAILRAVHEATDTLLIYYAGHAERDDKGELYLTTYASRSGATEIAFSGLRYKVLEECVKNSPAQNRILVLDCCHSGAASPMSGAALLERPEAPAVATDEEAEIEGTCVLTSCRANQVSLDSDGQGFTAFTGHLIRVLRDGVPGAPGLLDLDTVYRQVLASMRHLEQNPRKTGGDTVSGLALVRNAAPEGAGRPAVAGFPPHPSPPPPPPAPAPLPPAAAPVPPAGRGRRRRPLAMLAAAAVLVAGGIGTGFWLGHGGRTDGAGTETGARPTVPSKGPTGRTPSTTPTGTPTGTGDGEQGGAPAHSPPGTPAADSAAGAVRPHPGEPLPMKFIWSCDDVTWIDFDAYPFTQRLDKDAPEVDDRPDTVDMTLSSCSPGLLTTMRGSHGGVIAEGKPVTRESCRHEAYAGGLEHVTMGWDDTQAGLVRGATVCVVTDKGRVVKALITDKPDYVDAAVAFEVSTLS